MKLTNQDIGDVIEKIQNFFQSTKISKKDQRRICLLIEEALLRFQDNFGEDKNFHLVTKKWFGTPKISIKIFGKPYNPLEDNEDEQIFSQNVINNLLNYEKATVIYRYEQGYNEISALFPKQEVRKIKIPGGSITISILLAFILGFLCKELPEQTRTILTHDIVSPILSTLLGAITAINLPLIFISVVASICTLENVSMLNNLGSKILIRFFVIMFGISFLSIFVCGIFFPVINWSFGESLNHADKIELKIIFDLILSIVPNNVFTPFVEGNILQVVTLALLLGICITILGNSVADFKEWILNVKQLTFKMAGIIFKIIPAIIFLCLFKTILSDSSNDILKVWKIIASEYILFLSIMIIMLLMIAIKYNIKIVDFLKKISPAFSISFTTGSGSASMPKNMEICKSELNIDESLCNFYIPLSHAICQTSKIIGIVTCTFFAAEFSHAEISIAQTIIIAFLAVQFSIAMVSGNGGMIATMSLLLTQLNFSLDAIGAMTIADIFVANLSGVVALIVRDCDLIDVSHTVKLSA